MGKFTLQDIFQLDRLPTVPGIAKRIIAQLKEPKLNFAKFSETLRFDPALSTTLISRANEIMKCEREIASVSTAIRTCGPEIALSIVKEMSVPEICRPSHQYFPMFQMGWSSCISQAIAAESLTQFGLQDSGSTMFQVGLGNDMGVLAIMATYPETYYKKVWLELGPDSILCELEQSAFGFSHVTIGHELARNGHLGEAFSASILQHHNNCNGNFYGVVSQCAAAVISQLDYPDNRDVVSRRNLEKLKVCFRLGDKEIVQLLKLTQQIRRKILPAIGLKIQFPTAAAVAGS